MVGKEETYRFLHIEFYVYPLYQWALKNLELVEVSLDDIARSYGFDLPPDRISMFSCDKEYAMSLSEEKLETPAIVIDLGASGQLMIDGTHRSYKKWKRGDKTIQAYYITDEKILLKHSNLTKQMLKKLKAA